MFFVAILVVSVPIASISVWQGDTQDFIQDIFEDEIVNEIENEEESPDSLVEWDVHYAMTSTDLPLCDSSTEGRLYYVQSSMEFQVCLSNGWSVIDIEGPQGDNGISILMRVSTSSFCPFTGHEFELGNDANENGALEDGEVVVSVDICDGADGIDGENGTNGVNGINSLTEVTEEISGTNCASGGIKIDFGLDANYDGVLNQDEVDITRYVCNGIFSSNVLITTVDDLGITENCTAGQYRISSGMDNGLANAIAGNGELEPSEVTLSSLECHKIAYGPIGDLTPGMSPGEINWMVNHGQEIYYSHQKMLIKINVTDESSTILCECVSYSFGSWNGFSPIFTDNGLMYFLGTHESTGQYTRVLWVTNGTVSGTSVVMNDDVQNGGPTRVSTSIPFMTDGVKVYFQGSNDELWVSDSTTSGTYMVLEINPNSNTYLTLNVVDSNGWLYFTANDGTHGEELWKTDGTSINTSMVKDIALGQLNGGVYGCIEFDGYIYFTGGNGYSMGGSELWRTNGTEDGTSKFFDINDDIYSSYPTNYHIVGDHLIFQATNSLGEDSIWSTDGTVSGTNQISNITTFNSVLSTGDFLYWLGSTPGVHDYEVWRTDGTAINTTIVTETGGHLFVQNLYSSSFSFPNTLIGDNLYFSNVIDVLDNGEFKQKEILFEHNITTNITNQVYVSYIHVNYEQFDNLCVIDEVLYFSSVSEYGREIFAYGKSIIVDEEQIL